MTKLSAHISAAQPSSTDSFLDAYQTVRLGLSLGGWAILLGFAPSYGLSVVRPYMVGLGLMAGHAVWCRIQRVRLPGAMLVLDTTAWGAMMLLAGIPVISTAIVAFLFVLVVQFSNGILRLGLLGYSAAWFAISSLTSDMVPLEVGHVLGVLLITGGLAAMISRVRGWFDRMDMGRSQMLGMVSHELKNNLTGMIGLTQLVGIHPDMSYEEAKELVALAHQQAVDANEIVEDLLTAVRLESAALKVAIDTIDVNEEVETTVRRFSGESTAMTTETASRLPAAAADALRVRQILRNLVSNAVRYGGDSIRITTSAANGLIQVTVADNGNGVPQEDERTIFLPYRRSTKSEHAESVGLGLWISRQLAVAMKGSLEYRRNNDWTEFVLTLPAAMPGKDFAIRSAAPAGSG
jgi:signal transduction histidine kinase